MPVVVAPFQIQGDGVCGAEIPVDIQMSKIFQRTHGAEYNGPRAQSHQSLQTRRRMRGTLPCVFCGPRYLHINTFDIVRHAMEEHAFESAGGIRRRTFLAAAAGTALFAGIPGFVRETFAKASAPSPTVGKTLPVGDFAVVPLFDGPQSYALNRFYGADEATMLKTAGTQPVPASYNVFLIKRGKERFLVDTGNGALTPARTGQLPVCLKDAQTAPADIGKILITHLHGDHAGGLVKDGKPAFPRAKVYVAKAEYDFWTNEESLRLVPEQRRGLFPLIRNVLRVLEQDRQIVFFTPGEVVSPEVTSVDLVGHTPGHTGFLLASQGKKLFFAGDLLHGAALQLPRPDITIDADVDQPKAKETRLRMFKQLAETKTPVAGAHLPFPGIGVLQSAGEGYTLTSPPSGKIPAAAK
jgi:glyoxylase-like metal-dependent hydrolase (beta-lactamase superfamily II)